MNRAQLHSYVISRLNPADWARAEGITAAVLAEVGKTGQSAATVARRVIRERSVAYLSRIEPSDLEDGPVTRAPRPRTAQVAAPFSSETRVAIISDFRAARDRQDREAARLVYRLAADHDGAYPEEPSLVDELTGLHVNAMGLVA